MTKENKKIYKKHMKIEKKNVKRLIKEYKEEALSNGEDIDTEIIMQIRRRERGNTVAEVLREVRPEECKNNFIMMSNTGRIKVTTDKERKLVSEIRKDLNELYQKRLLTRFIAILAAVGVSIGAFTGGVKSLSETNDLVNYEEYDNTDGEEEKDTELDTEDKEETEIEDEIYSELGSLSAEKAKIDFKKLYKELYEQLNDEEINISRIKIIKSSQNYINVVTLDDGSEIAVLHGDYPDETKQALEELGVTYETQQTKIEKSYVILYDDEVIDGTIGSYKIVSIENLEKYLSGEKEDLPSAASVIPKNIKEIMINYMSGNTVSAEDRRTISKWIAENGLEESILGTTKEQNVEKESSESSRDNFLSELQSYTTEIEIENSETSSTQVEEYEIEINSNKNQNENDGR